jgi:hypothetical protein
MIVAMIPLEKLGFVIPVGSFDPMVIGNGLGLDSVPETGLLYVSGLSATQVFQRILEPATLSLFAIGCSLLDIRRR